MSEKEIADLQASFNELKAEFQSLKEMIKPMTDSYNAMNKLGSWAKYFLYVAGAIVGLFLALREVFKK